MVLDQTRPDTVWVQEVACILTGLYLAPYISRASPEADDGQPQNTFTKGEQS